MWGEKSVPSTLVAAGEKDIVLELRCRQHPRRYGWLVAAGEKDIVLERLRTS